MSYYTSTATVASTSYPATPQFVGPFPGRWAVSNVGNVRVLASFDGTTDHAGVPPNVTWDSMSPTSPPRIWLRLAAAGSVDVTGNLTARGALGQ